jgi:hypothetical protein
MSFKHGNNLLAGCRFKLNNVTDETVFTLPTYMKASASERPVDDVIYQLPITTTLPCVFTIRICQLDAYSLLILFDFWS